MMITSTKISSSDNHVYRHSKKYRRVDPGSNKYWYDKYKEQVIDTLNVNNDRH